MHLGYSCYLLFESATVPLSNSVLSATGTCSGWRDGEDKAGELGRFLTHYLSCDFHYFSSVFLNVVWTCMNLRSLECILARPEAPDDLDLKDPWPTVLRLFDACQSQLGKGTTMKNIGKQHVEDSWSLSIIMCVAINFLWRHFTSSLSEVLYFSKIKHAQLHPLKKQRVRNQPLILDTCTGTIVYSIHLYIEQISCLQKLLTRTLVSRWLWWWGVPQLLQAKPWGLHWTPQICLHFAVNFDVPRGHMTSLFLLAPLSLETVEASRKHMQLGWWSFLKNSQSSSFEYHSYPQCTTFNCLTELQAQKFGKWHVHTSSIRHHPFPRRLGGQGHHFAVYFDLRGWAKSGYLGAVGVPWMRLEGLRLDERAGDGGRWCTVW